MKYLLTPLFLFLALTCSAQKTANAKIQALQGKVDSLKQAMIYIAEGGKFMAESYGALQRVVDDMGIILVGQQDKIDSLQKRIDRLEHRQQPHNEPDSIRFLPVIFRRVQ